MPPLLTDEEWANVIRVFALSPQQARVVELILQGKRDKQIAAELGLSIWTVRTHLTKIFSRIGATDRTELLLHIFHLVRDPNRDRHPKN